MKARNRFEAGGNTKEKSAGSNAPFVAKKDKFERAVKSGSIKKESKKEFKEVDYSNYMTAGGVLDEKAYAEAIEKANPTMFMAAPKSKSQKAAQKIVKEVKKNKSK